MNRLFIIQFLVKLRSTACRIGERVRPMLKGRFGVVHGSVLEHLTPFHLQLETSSRDDIDETAIVKQVRQCLN